MGAPPPQYAPPAWQQQPPAYGAPQQAPYPGAAPIPGSSPMPPSMHWALVLVLAMFTGIFGLIWFFIQAAYIKKIDPSSRARLFLVLAIVASLGQFVATFVMAGAALGGSTAGAGLGMALVFGCVVLSIIFMLSAVFGMRRSLLDHFNTVEPIGLRLSGVMTFFFNILYFQYHLTRIAEWKKTGVWK